MKCRECPDYAKCAKESNLTIKRKNCSKAKTEKVKTNADRIRAMSDEELAEWLGEHLDCIDCPVGVTCVHGNGCPGSLVDWLKQPAK